MFKHTRYRILTLICLVIVFVGCNNQEKDAHTNHPEKRLPVYTCPMHPEIIRNVPGTCPVCGMDLVKKEKDADGIRDIELNDLLQPTNTFVISSIPVTAIKQSEENIELDVLGNVSQPQKIKCRCFLYAKHVSSYQGTEENGIK